MAKRGRMKAYIRTVKRRMHTFFNIAEVENRKAAKRAKQSPGASEHKRSENTGEEAERK